MVGTSEEYMYYHIMSIGNEKKMKEYVKKRLKQPIRGLTQH